MMDEKSMLARIKRLDAEMPYFKGNSVERDLRSQVQSQFGDRFGRCFTIKGLGGLSHLIGAQKDPSTYFPTEHPIIHEELSDLNLMSASARHLAFSMIMDGRFYRLICWALSDQLLPCGEGTTVVWTT
eukprot:gb/GECG01009542.1/.p1 GENE.gb/GECG01009542.1/~~gb/GECG01009542.1/.p1  ORF type:complete len:128 (+),score=15.77 gb/GECG01009542.1/:1-384(+)